MLVCCRQLLVQVALGALLVASLSCEGFWVDPTIVSIAVTPPSPSLLTGFTQQFMASATYDDGAVKLLSAPAWTSSNSTIVFINGSGVATAVAPGSVTISASSGGIAGSTTVSVTTSPLTSIEISPLNITITAAQGTQQFSATATFSDGTVRDITNGVTWTSSDKTIATINSTGLATVTGRQGSTTITASSGDVSQVTTLTVMQ